MATLTASQLTEKPQRRSLKSTAGRSRDLAQFDLPPEIDDGVYCVGSTDGFGKAYDIRAIASRTKEMRKAQPNYIMSDEELEQFRR